MRKKTYGLVVGFCTSRTASRHRSECAFNCFGADCIWILLYLLIMPGGGIRARAEENDNPADDYPLSLQLRTLEEDLTSDDYKSVLATMIPTDLAAEWQRVATPDNHLLFQKKHGGKDNIHSNAKLRRAWQRRKQIADAFLNLVREAYTKKKRRPPFDDEELLRATLESAKSGSALAKTSEIEIEYLMPTAGSQEHWPAFRGPTGQGVVFDARMPLRWTTDDNVAWKVKLPGRGNSSPVIWGNRIMITAEHAAYAGSASPETTDRLLLCYDRSNGELLWKHTSTRPTELETLYWKNSFASSTPVTDGERVIVFFGNSGLTCCDMRGKQLWHQDLGTFPTMHGPGSTPVLYRDLVILVQDQTKGDSFFAAFDKRTGEQRWRHPRDNAACWTTPVLARVVGRDELIVNGSNNVNAYDPGTGKLLWTIVGSSREAIPMIVTGSGLIYSFSGRNGPVFAIRPGGDGKLDASDVVWSERHGGPHVPTPAYHDNRLYIISDTGIATCREADTGKVIWQKRLRGKFSMPPLVVGEHLLLINEEGKAYVVRCGDEFSILAENDFGERVLATPAILDGRIYCRTEQHLICIMEME